MTADPIAPSDARAELVRLLAEALSDALPAEWKSYGFDDAPVPLAEAAASALAAHPETVLRALGAPEARGDDGALRRQGGDVTVHYRFDVARPFREPRDNSEPRWVVACGLASEHFATEEASKVTCGMCKRTRMWALPSSEEEPTNPDNREDRP